MSRAPRILLVAYYFPPIGGGGVSRTLAVLRRLAEEGFSPWVLTVDDAAWRRDPSRLAEVPPGTRVTRLANPDWGRVRAGRPRTPAAPAAAGAGRLRRWLVPDLHVGWSALATPVAALLAATRSVDLVYTTCPPYSAHAPGLAARALGVPWIADFRDGWTCCPTRADLPPRRVALERRMEDAVLRRADAVFFASPAVRTRCCARVAGLAERSETFLTGYHAPAFEAALAPPAVEAALATPPVEPALATPAAADRFEIVHAGSVATMRRQRTLDRLVAVLARWARIDPSVPARVRVRFVGAEPEVAPLFAAAGLDAWVRVEPEQPRTRLPATLRRAQLCLALGSAGARGSDPIPGKLFDAAGARRPLLAIAGPGALADLVRELGIGAVVEPDDAEGLLAALRTARRRAQRGESALPFDVQGAERLDGRRTVGRVVEVARSLLDAGGPPRLAASARSSGGSACR